MKPATLKTWDAPAVVCPPTTGNCADFQMPLLVERPLTTGLLLPLTARVRTRAITEMLPSTLNCCRAAGMFQFSL
jgi:hypothetical protein